MQVKATQGILTTLFRGVGGVFFAVLSRWKLSITLIIILVIFLGGLQDSIQQRSPLPLLRELAGRTLAVDTEIYKESARIAEEGGIYVGEEDGKLKTLWGMIKSVSSLLAGLWILFFIFFAVFKIVQLPNTSAKARNIMLTVLIVALIQVFFAMLLLTMDGEKHEPSEVMKLVIPFRGVVKFATISPFLINPIYERVEHIIPQQNNTITIINV